MRTFILVNKAHELKAAQSTAWIAAELCRRGHPVYVSSVDGLGLTPDGAATVRAQAVSGHSATELVNTLKISKDPPARFTLGPGDLVLVRTNPGRDPRPWAHSTALELLRAARDGGATVHNDPDALARASSKLFLRHLPQAHQPTTLVSRNAADLRAFVASCETGAVLKPLDGTQGRDVFRLRRGRPENIAQIIDLLTRDGHCMAQAFVPEAPDGDVRLLLVNGRLLQVDGEVAAVRRVPGGDDFRSNVHVGGTATRVQLDARLQEVAAACGPALRAAGIFLCGLDVIGDKVVEVNVFSPGGFQDAGRFGGVDFIVPLVDALESSMLDAGAQVSEPS